MSHVARKIQLVAAGVTAAITLAFAGAAMEPRLGGQSENEPPLAFEVASIRLLPVPPIGRPVTRMPRAMPFQISGLTVFERNASLQELIMDAYDVKRFQVTGGPAWGKVPEGDRYEIQAKAPGSTPPTPAQVRRMIQSLLADRFQLKLHRETKDLSVYELTVDKNGSKLKAISASDPPRVLGSPIVRSDMLAIVTLLNLLADRPVIDKTGFSGIYQYDTSWVSLARARTDGEPTPSLVTLVQENLGLQLVPRKAPIEMLMIDRVEKPSEN